jgi:predicted component of type VI protein secretion system
LPVIEEVSGSFELTAKVMGILLDCQVSVREGKKSKHPLDRKDSVTLGNWRLGINSVPGKTIENDNVDLEITIGPISPEQMRLFESNATNDRILKSLIDLTIPFDRSTRVKYRIREAEKKFHLSDKTHKAYLGINTTL